ncbi:MAG: hypothetical protein JRF70_09515 [Deltaproteobacteria bacterium]|nr:hypothetical protein [Deltaproteobacteria bacterium]
MTASRDLDYGSFADDAPCTLDLEYLPWRAGLEETRRAAINQRVRDGGSVR